ncbi:MAG TPA: gephyrin-like molybdotransferase Glp [Thermoanaerobaculia bacterium]|nr:gephyrin-like molybdotransferase Glp [Thermoanaerobaculia bacterium]
MRPFQDPGPGQRLLTVEEAQERVLAAVAPLDSESVRFDEAFGRVLREDVAAAADVPPHDNSAMDGYALVAADVEAAGEQNPVVLEVTGDVAAGRGTNDRVERGTAMRIMTGAPVPDGADAVAQVEITDGGAGSVRVLRAVAQGRNIRRRGEDMRAGHVVLRSGIRIGAGEVGVLATARKVSVLVGRRPRVAILATGDEIADVAAGNEGKTVNSNSYALAALVREAGGEPSIRDVVPDDRAATIAAIDSASSFDFVVSSGGVSVGAYDFVREALEALGAEAHFWRVAMKPGKPTLMSKLGRSMFFGLPGNPVSCLVSFTLFAGPALRKAAGQTAGLLPPVVTTRAAAPLQSAGDRRTYLRVRVTARDGALHSEPMPSQGSGVSTSMAGANGLAVVEEGVRLVEAGAAVPTVLLAAPFSP